MDADAAYVAIHEAQEDIKHALAAAIYQTGLKVLRDSAREAPVDTGRLRNSRFGTVPMPDNPEMVVGYGVAYARRQHEEHATNSKYLQRPFEQEATIQKIAARTAKNYNAGRSIAGVAGGETLPSSAGEAAHFAKAGPSKRKAAAAKARKTKARVKKREASAKKAAKKKADRIAKTSARKKAKIRKKVSKVKAKVSATRAKARAKAKGYTLPKTRKRKSKKGPVTVRKRGPSSGHKIPRPPKK